LLAVVVVALAAPLRERVVVAVGAHVWYSNRSKAAAVLA